MKKKILALCLVVVLAVTAVTGATLAYFTDWDGDVNVMVTGNVHIDQTEEFEEGSDLLPGEDLAVEKKVYVENVGNQDAYVRTLFAFEDSWDASALVHYEYVDELGLYPAANWKPTWPANGEDYLQFKATVTDAEGNAVETIYTVGYFEYGQEVFAPGDKVQTLDSIWLDPTADNNWTAKVGANYDVLVLSQGVQVAGFENDYAGAFKATFGEVNEKSDALVAGWFQKVLADKYPDSTVTVEAFNYADYVWENMPTDNDDVDHDLH